MTSRNDITGDLIKTKASGDKDAYAEGWDRIFGKKRAADNSSDSGRSADSERDTPLVAETHKILRRETKWEGHPIDLAKPETTADKPVEPTLCDICGKELNKVGECAWTSCPLNWDETRADIVGQNGNVGYGEDAS